MNDGIRAFSIHQNILELNQKIQVWLGGLGPIKIKGVHFEGFGEGHGTLLVHYKPLPPSDEETYGLTVFEADTPEGFNDALDAWSDGQEAIEILEHQKLHRYIMLLWKKSVPVSISDHANMAMLNLMTRLVGWFVKHPRSGISLPALIEDFKGSEVDTKYAVDLLKVMEIIWEDEDGLLTLSASVELQRGRPDLSSFLGGIFGL